MSASARQLLHEAADTAPPYLVEAAGRAIRAGTKPGQAAFLARALNALARLLPEIDERAWGDAAGAPSDYAALLRALEQPEAVAVLGREDPLAPARLRGLCATEQLLQQEGGTVSATDAASLLGISRQAVDKRRRAGRLLGLPLGRRGYAYPVWQCARGRALPGLEAVLAELDDRDPWMQIIFFLNPHSRLDDETPLAKLRHGDLESVKEVAGWYGEQVAD